MTSPVNFIPCRSGNRDIAMLGENMIGYVVDYAGGRSVRAYWRCLLFDGMQQAPATSRPMGRKLLLKRAAEWFDRSGRAELERLAIDLRMQAEGEGV